MKEKIKNFRFTRKAFAYPYMLFLLVFVVTPLVLILANAFIYDGKFSFKNFAIFFTEKSSLVVLGNSILVGLLTTIICIVLGYPAAYFLAKYSASKIFVLLFILPMWVNFLIRTLADESDFRVAEHSARNGNGRVRHGLQLSAVYDTSFAHGAFEH